MKTKKVTLMSHRRSWITILGMVLVTIASAAALAVIGGGVSDPPRAAASEDRVGGKVLPPTAKPQGYSLSEMAKITAVFNTGDHSGPPPVTPFQMLYTSSTNAFDVTAGTMFYVPVWTFDDTTPILGDFPFAFFNAEEQDENERGVRKALLHYIFSDDEAGVDSTEIKVDGKVFSLGSDYVVGATTPPLSDCIFVPASFNCIPGTHYITSAAFVTALTKGTHTVEIDGYIDGKALQPYPQFFPGGVENFSITYTVIVH